MLGPFSRSRSMDPATGHNPTARKYQPMKTSAKFYHAGCPVCLDAERAVTRYLDPSKVSVEIVHLGNSKNRIAEAEAAGVKSVPALVIDGRPLHLNFGAALSALK